MNNILVPVDGSEYSGMAARWAVDVAKRVGAKVTAGIGRYDGALPDVP